MFANSDCCSQSARPPSCIVAAAAGVVVFSAWNMMDETHLINAVKQRLCLVSMDYLRDLQLAAKIVSPFKR